MAKDKRKKKKKQIVATIGLDGKVTKVNGKNSGKTTSSGNNNKTVVATIGLDGKITKHNNKTAPIKTTKKRTYFNKGLFEDGYDFGDVTKTILGTAGDLTANTLKGAAELGQGLTQIGVGGIGRAAEALGKDKYAAQLRKRIEDVDEMATVGKVFDAFSTRFDKSSVAGEKTDTLLSSVGQLLTGYAVQSVAKLPATGVLGASAAGHELGEAYKSGATEKEAWTSAAISGVSEAVFEKLGGIKFGGKAWDTGAKKWASQKIANKTLQTVAKFGMDAGVESIEEVATSIAQRVGQNLTYEDEETLREYLTNEEAMDQYLEGAIGGFVIGGGSNIGKTVRSIKTGRDYDTGLTDNEQSVANAEVERRTTEKQKEAAVSARVEELIQQEGREDLSAEEKQNLKNSVMQELEDGTLDYSTTTISKKELREIEKQVDEDLKAGYIGIDTIESTLSSEKTSRINELRSLLNETTKDTEKSEIEAELNQLEGARAEEMKGLLEKDSILQESYRQEMLKGESFSRKTTDKDSDITKELIESAKAAGMNNTRKMHNLFEYTNKIANDSKTKYAFTNNERLKRLGHYKEGKTINGLVRVSEDGSTKVLINVDSAKALNTIIGHETTHLLEGSEEHKRLVDIIKEYATTKGEYDSRLKELSELYKGTKADLENEITADLVGDYLFTDEQFIHNLSTKEPSLFKKIYDYIKHAYKMATAGSEEKRQLEKAKRMFDKAYKQMSKTGAKSDGETKHSLSSMANSFFGDPNMSANEFLKTDSDGELLYKQSDGYLDYVEQCLNNMRQTREDFDEETARESIEKQLEGIVEVAVAAKKAGYDIMDYVEDREGVKWDVTNKTDSKKRLLFSSLEPNSDYFTSHDISTICDKRKNFTEIYEAIVKAEEAQDVPKEKRFFNNVDNYFYIHKVLADKGLTQPCRQCYVESMRKNLAPMAKAFMELVNETNAENKSNKQLYNNKGELKSNNAKLREDVLYRLNEYGMSVSDLTIENLSTGEGLAYIKLKAPLVYEAFNSFYGQSKPKMPKEATPFRFGELTALLTNNDGKISKSRVDMINSTGGFRLQSYSDFQIENYVDVLQVIFEAGTLGLTGHAYTKVPAFLDATEGTNLKRNLSIFMYKDGDKWKIDRNDSFPYALEEIYDIVNSDKTGNTGIIAVTQNAEMAAWVMANDNVGYFIPFHKSGIKMGVVRDTDVVTEDGRTVKGYKGTIDHTKQQSEVYAKTTKYTYESKGEIKEKTLKANTKVKKPIDIYDFWDFENKDNLSKNELIEKNVKEYIDRCIEAGYKPKFRAYLENNGKVLNDVLKFAKEFGAVSQDATISDIAFEYRGYTIPYGYYKSLGDFGMFDPDGNASPQEILSLENYDFEKAKAFFDEAENLRREEILQQFANGTEREKYRNSDLNSKQLEDVVKRRRDEVVDFITGGDKTRYSMSDNIAPIRNDYKLQKSDSDYMTAVENGDMETAQRLVDEVAKESLKESKLRMPDGKLRKVYHGTNTGDFNVFNPSYIGMSSGDDGFFGMGYYFAYSKGEASYYGADRIIEAYLDLKNPFNFDKELQTYNGEKAESGKAPDAVALMNFADKFPEIAENVVVNVARKGDDEIHDISLIEFATEFKKVIENKEFEYQEDTNEWGELETLVLADKETHEYEYDGKKRTYTDYGFQKRFYGKAKELDAAYVYLSEAVYDYVDIPSRTQLILDVNREFTEELKNRGYDGVIQSEHGDEAVVFESSQIKSADPVTYDDNGNVIPLSERFNVNNDDIRYSMSDDIAPIRNDYKVQENSDDELDSFFDMMTDEDFDRLFEGFTLSEFEETVEDTNEEIFNDEPKKSKYKKKTKEKGKVARLTNERIEGLYEEYAITPTRTKAYVTTIHPRDFLNLTLPDELFEHWDRLAQEGTSPEFFPLDLEKLKNQKQTPYLGIDGKGRVLAHEGRHRMRALLEVGVTEVPIAIVDESTDEKDWDNWRILHSQDWGSGPVNNDAIAVLEDLYPLNEEYRAEIYEKFGGEGDVRFSLSNQNETKAPTGNYNVYGKDVLLPPVETAPAEEEAIAPIRTPEAPETAAEDIAPVVTGKATKTIEADGRGMDNVGNRKVKAYMYENPEVKPFFQEEAELMLTDLKEYSVKGERHYSDTLYDTGDEAHGFTGTKRFIDPSIGALIDEYKYTREEVEKGLKAIIEDNGAENNAVSKRLEFLIDERLREGYTDMMYGDFIPPNEEYIQLLEDKQINEYSDEAYEAYLRSLGGNNSYQRRLDTRTGEVKDAFDYIPPDIARDNVEPPQGEGVQQEMQGDGTIGDAEDISKKTRRELQRELLAGDSDYIIRALEEAKNIPMALMNNTDTIRNNELVLGREAGKKVNEAIFQKAIDNEARSIYWQNKQRADIKALGIKARSKESAAVQKYGEGEYVNEFGELVQYGEAELMNEFPNEKTQEKIKEAARAIKLKYEYYIDRANGVLTGLGFDPIPKRKDYMRHFQELSDVFSKNGLPFNPQNIQEHVLPTDINGLTEFWSPQKNYFANMQPRKGMRTTLDAVTGIDGYIGGIANLIFHTEDIQRGRAYEGMIRENFGEERGWDILESLPEDQQAARAELIGNNHLSNYAAWVHEWTNNLAGKKNKVDRSIEAMFGRRGFSVLDTIRKQIGANMIGFNIASSLTNLISPIQAIAKTNKVSVMKGTVDTFRNIVSRDDFVNNNAFLTSRFGTDMLSKTKWQKAQDAGYMFMKGVDYFSANLIVRSKYNELIKKGMGEKQAHKEAGRFAARIMGDRSKGANAQLYNSKMIGVLTQFQLEVNNQLYSMFYDTYHDSKENAKGNAAKTAAGMTFVLGQLFAFTHVFGKAFESVAGYNPTFDVLGIVGTLLGAGDDDEEEKTFAERSEAALQQLIKSLPYSSIFSGGRIPIGSALPIKQLFEGKDEYGNEKSRWETLKETAPYYLMPGGYNQAKKTAGGLKMFSDDNPVAGSYTDSGNLRFPVEETPMNVVHAAIFGQWANKNAQDYIDNGRLPLRENQIEEYKELDIPIADYWKIREGLKGKDTVSEKLDYIINSDIPEDKKNIYYATYDPKGYAMSQAVGGYKKYKRYSDTLYNIKANKDKNGESVRGTRKVKVANYIRGLEIPEIEKHILFKSEYNSEDTHNREILDYLYSKNMTDEQREVVLKKLGFEVSGDTVYW